MCWRRWPSGRRPVAGGVHERQARTGGARWCSAGLAGAELRYHGDFDWAGVAMANRLIAEVGVVPWRMGADDYTGALEPSRSP